MRKTSLVRFALFAAVTAFHLLLILFFTITMDAVIAAKEPPVSVMKLTDFEEEAPPPPPPPPPEPPPPVPENAVESIAETMIETEEVPEDQVLVDPGTLIVSQAPPVRAAENEEEYLPMHRISVPPVFSERDLLADLVYPPIALRSGIEGTVYLELFIDRRGEVRQVTVLRENPPGRGFGDAAVNAFRGRKGKPAEANGVPVGVRYRYPVRFTIKG
ncbi:MAG: energy transducer TonB [Treponema sp.]|jgi:protein TonB|nr:energy transducer TonB [Treponema sp.]